MTPAPPSGFAGGFYSPQTQTPQQGFPSPLSTHPHPQPFPSPPRTPQPPLPAITPVQPNWVGGATPPPIPASQRHSILDLGFNDSQPPRPSSVRPITPPGSTPPALTAPLPTLQTLQQAWKSLQTTPDPARRVAWCKDVFSLVDRTLASAGQAPDGPLNLSDSVLQRLAEQAVDIIRNMTANASPATPQQPLPAYMAEALYHRGSLGASGMFPAVFPPSPRASFRDFETAARAGFAPAWFKLGRDYESVGDFIRARDCFERGVRTGVGSCFYRIGMAHLQGQLGITPPNPQNAIPLLQRAAVLASVDVPQPAHVYALLLLGEFPGATVPPQILAQVIPAGSSAVLESRKYLERAAYLGFAAAQCKLGHAYEYAVPPFGFDPLVSVQYYSLASQAGEAEADMALSKWFLCGAPGEGGFDRDEALAVVFAEKAARRGFPSAEFAMGYYSEVGVGGVAPNINAARKWYQKAARGGNDDAKARLRELEGGGGKMIDRKEHEGLAEDKLVRKRTQARERAQANGAGVGGAGGSKNTEAASAPPPQSGSTLAPPRPQQQPASTSTSTSTSKSTSTSTLAPTPAAAPAATLAPTRPTQADAIGLARAASKSQNTGGYKLRKERKGGGGGTPGASPKPASNAPLPSTNAPAPNVVVYPAQPSKGPATFQEMGYHSQKLDEKDCIIM
jgi:TPR repeat protein